MGVLVETRTDTEGGWMAEIGERKSLMSEGFRVGILGAAVVAAWFLVIDLVSGSPLQTPGALGSAVFLGARSPAEVEIGALTVGLYTLLHGAGFILLGIAAAALVRAADRAPSTLALIVLGTVVLEVLFVGGVAIVAEFLLGFLAWWTVLGGNLLASLAMGTVLLRWHPATAERLAQVGEPISRP